MSDFERLIMHKAGRPMAILDSQRVIVMHGHKNGALPALNNENVLSALEEGYRVACCYPKQVKARYGLDVIGNWSTETEVYFVDRDGKIATSSEQAIELVIKSA